MTFNSWYTIIIAGGEDWDYNNYDDILEYDPEEDTITSVGHMTQARSHHALSVVDAADYNKWCVGSNGVMEQCSVYCIFVVILRIGLDI